MTERGARLMTAAAAGSSRVAMICDAYAGQRGCVPFATLRRPAKADIDSSEHPVGIFLNRHASAIHPPGHTRHVVRSGSDF